MNKLTSLFAALVCALAVCSCGSNALKGDWDVVEVYGIHLDEPFNEPFLSISQNSYHGNTGVNLISGKLRIFGKRVEFEDGPMTKMAADPESMHFENAFVEALDEAESFEVAGDTVLVKDEHGAVVMKLVKK